MLVYEAGWLSALGGPEEWQDRVGDGGRRPGAPGAGVRGRSYRMKLRVLCTTEWPAENPCPLKHETQQGP